MTQRLTKTVHQMGEEVIASLPFVHVCVDLLSEHGDLAEVAGYCRMGIYHKRHNSFHPYNCRHFPHYLHKACTWKKLQWHIGPFMWVKRAVQEQG